ncbi:hypothetical protein B0E37_05823 [Streptomyces sp. MH192]|nr:hypothetical protein [Streptomyces sp. MH192]MCF0103048.1 hypothetical protein [Streptomyces sp. MH191]
MLVPRRTWIPWRRASWETTYRPMRPSCSRLATLTWSGSASSAFMRCCSASGMPRPRSSTSTASPAVTRLTRSRTWVCGAENTVAFSTSSASRWMTSATACPRSRPSTGGTSRTREYCSTSAMAERRTSVISTGLLHCRRETAPPSTARFSAWRRMRVERWSTWKRPLSRSGSSISFSSSSSVEISRCTRDCSRLARLRKTSSFCSLPARLDSWAARTTAATAPSCARARSAARSSKSSAPEVSAAGRPRPPRLGTVSPRRSASTRARRSASPRVAVRRSVSTRSLTESAARPAATAAVSTPATATPRAPESTAHSVSVGSVPVERMVKSTAAQPARATATGGSTASRSSCGRMCVSVGVGAVRAAGRPCRPPSRRSARVAGARR